MTTVTISSEALAQRGQIVWLRSVCQQAAREAAAIDFAAVGRVLVFFGLCAVYFMFFG